MRAAAADRQQIRAMKRAPHNCLRSLNVQAPESGLVSLGLATQIVLSEARAKLS